MGSPQLRRQSLTKTPSKFDILMKHFELDDQNGSSPGPQSPEPTPGLIRNTINSMRSNLLKISSNTGSQDSNDSTELDNDNRSADISSNVKVGSDNSDLGINENESHGALENFKPVDEINNEPC